jgi:hypothetical protein
LPGSRDEGRWMAKKDWFNVTDPLMKDHGEAKGTVAKGEANNYLKKDDWDKYYTMKHIDGFEEDDSGKPKKVKRNQIIEGKKYKDIWHQSSHGTTFGKDNKEVQALVIEKDNSVHGPCYFCERRHYPPNSWEGGGCKGTDGKVISGNRAGCVGSKFYAFEYWCRWEDDVDGSPGWLDNKRDPEDINKSEVGFYGLILCEGTKYPGGKFDYITADDFNDKIDTPSISYTTKKGFETWRLLYWLGN